MTDIEEGLLDEVDRLTRERDKARAEVEQLHAKLTRTVHERAEARASLRMLHREHAEALASLRRIRAFSDEISAGAIARRAAKAAKP